MSRQNGDKARWGIARKRRTVQRIKDRARRAELLLHPPAPKKAKPVKAKPVPPPPPAPEVKAAEAAAEKPAKKPRAKKAAAPPAE